MRRWYIKLDKYGIDRDLYAELKAFCRQYDAKKQRLNAIYGGFNQHRIDGMPRGSAKGDPTGRRAEQAMRLSRDVAAIEQAIEFACEPGVREYMLKHVAYGIRLRDLPVPAGQSKFFAERRVFFWRLAIILGKIDEE